MADEGTPGTGRYAGQVWDGKRWIPAAEAPAGQLLPGTIGADGRVWDGQFWCAPNSPTAESIQRALAAGDAPAVAATTPAVVGPSRQDLIDRAVLRTARASEATAFGLMAILVAVAGLIAVGIAGASAGAIFALGGLVAAAVFAVIAFTKVIGKDYLPPR